MKTPAQTAKAVGLHNLSQVSRQTGVSLQTLHNWHKNKPELFRIVLLGCVALQESQELKVGINLEEDELTP